MSGYPSAYLLTGQ